MVGPSPRFVARKIFPATLYLPPDTLGPRRSGVHSLCPREQGNWVPRELEYRFLGRDLILWDVHAGLIVDFVPRALAETTEN